MTKKKDKTAMRGVDGFGRKVEKKDAGMGEAQPSTPPAPDTVAEAVALVTGGPDAPVRHVSVMTEDRLLPVTLTDLEKINIGLKVAAAVQRAAELQDEIAEFKAGAKLREQSIEGEIAIKAALIRQGYEHRKVECETVKDYDAGTIIVRRLDTSETVETRSMNGSEKQMGFDSMERELASRSAGTAVEPTPEGATTATPPTDPTEDQLNEAIKIIQETHRASTSSLQRRMKLGYAAAARIMDALEARHVVGPANGENVREILMQAGDAKTGAGE